MRVRARTHITHDGRAIEPGAVADIDDASAAQLVQAGAAVPVDDDAEPPATPVEASPERPRRRRHADT